MGCIVPIVEGHGESDAVPLLVRRILYRDQRWQWSVARPIRAGNLRKLKNRLKAFIGYAEKVRGCTGILILLDLDDGCPAHAATELAEQVRQLKPHCPVAIVFAHREYEAWFLTSMETIARNRPDSFPLDLRYEKDVEILRGVKEWLSHQMISGKRYKPTLDQAGFTELMDMELASQRSRSFRRLCHAIEQLVLAESKDAIQVTP